LPNFTPFELKLLSLGLLEERRLNERKNRKNNKMGSDMRSAASDPKNATNLHCKFSCKVCGPI